MKLVFDETELLERVDNDLSFLAETAQMVETDGRELMKQIHRGLSAGDHAGVGRAAHTLKGMISNFCAPNIQALALEVETAGKRADIAAGKSAAGRLEVGLEALISDLTLFIKART